jgi:ABC-type molybdate transport system substrate-binding protein
MNGKVHVEAVSLFCALAVQGAFEEVILPRYQADTGTRVDATFEPTTELRRLMLSGARPDVALVVSSAIPELVSAGIIDSPSCVPVVRSGIGIAVAQGARADIGSVEALTRTLLQARSVAYSRGGASGIYFVQLLEKLGIAEEVNSRATIIPKGFTARAVVDGRADIAIQQLSELRFVPGVQIVGPLPEGAQHYTHFTAGMGVDATGTSRARELLSAFTADSAMDTYLQFGLQPQ